MKNKLIVLIFLLISAIVSSQEFNPKNQSTSNFQYFKPVEENLFAGDPMPFWHNGMFHVFWLLDSNHGSKPHQWAHVSTTDLKQWKHYTIAIKKDNDFESSICTGSVIYFNGKYYAFYATRTNENSRTEYISYAISNDGVNFIKQEPNKLIVAPEDCEFAHFRDPNVYYDDATKLFYMTITTALKKAQLDKNRYCLLYYTSTDLKNWNLKGPFYFTGSDKGFAYPECSDFFKWNNWYYLLFKIDGGTYYRVSKTPTGPWLTPVEDNLGSDYAMVLKTAGFINNRRIAVGFVPSRIGNKDDGGWQYGGNLLFREIGQNIDGSLKAFFPKEMLPQNDTVYKKDRLLKEYKINSVDKLSSIKFEDIPVNCHITCIVEPLGNNSSLGMLLRQSEAGFYELAINAKPNKVCLGSQIIEGVQNLNKPFTLEIVMKNDLIDVCIDGRRCLINRCPEKKGTNLYLFVHNGDAIFRDLIIEKLVE